MSIVVEVKRPFSQGTFWLSLVFSKNKPFNSFEKIGGKKDLSGSFRYIVFEIFLMHGVVSSSRAWGGKNYQFNFSDMLCLENP